MAGVRFSNKNVPQSNAYGTINNIRLGCSVELSHKFVLSLG
jgi:hypothetical protein